MSTQTLQQQLSEMVSAAVLEMDRMCSKEALEAYLAAGLTDPLITVNLAHKAALMEDREEVDFELNNLRRVIKTVISCQPEVMTLVTPEDQAVEKIQVEAPISKQSKGWLNLAIATKPEPVAKWAWKGWIRAGLPALLAGHGECGKGMLITGLAIATAAGVPFLGHPCIKGRVIVISAEDDCEELISRLNDVAEAMELNHDSIKKNITVFSSINAGVSPCLLEKNLKPTKLLKEIKRVGEILKPSLVILDTLASLAPPGADLTNATIATQYICGVVSSLSQEDGNGPAILMTHHLRKPDKTGVDSRPTIYDVRDSGAIIGSMRSVLILHKDVLTLDKCNSRRRVEEEFRISKNDALQLKWVSAPGCFNGALLLNSKAELGYAEERIVENAAKRKKKEDQGRLKAEEADKKRALVQKKQHTLPIVKSNYEAPVAL